MRVTSASSDSSFLTVSAAYNPAKPPPTITTRAAFLRTDVTGSSSEALQPMRVIHEHRPDGRDGDHEDQAHQLRGETPEHDGRILLKVLGASYDSRREMRRRRARSGWPGWLSRTATFRAVSRTTPHSRPDRPESRRPSRARRTPGPPSCSSARDCRSGSRRSTWPTL